MINPYVIIDGVKYAVVAGSYNRRWIRSFSSYLAASIVRLNFIDKGPGLRTYSMQLHLAPWGSSSLPYLSGVTDTPEQQMASLETSYKKIATPIPFTDPFNYTSPFGTYMTDLQQSIPLWGTQKDTYIIVTVELTEATQLVN